MLICIESGNIQECSISGLNLINSDTNIWTSGLLNNNNVWQENLVVDGNIDANFFIGDGSQLTGIIAESNYDDDDVANYISTTYGDLNNDLNYLQTGNDISLLNNDFNYQTFNNINDFGFINDYVVSEEDVTQHEGAIDHYNLKNFVVEQHINWTDAAHNFKTSGTLEATGRYKLTGSSIEHNYNADMIIENKYQDKDILIKVNDGGTTRTAIQVNGDEGSLSFPRMSAVTAVRATTSQTIPNTTITTVVCNSEFTDNLGEYDTSNGIFTAKDTGVYFVSGNVEWMTTSANMTYIVYIRVNGGHRLKAYMLPTSAFNYLSMPISGAVYVEAGQTITLSCYQATGGNEEIAKDYTYFTVAKIA